MWFNKCLKPNYNSPDIIDKFVNRAWKDDRRLECLTSTSQAEGNGFNSSELYQAILCFCLELRPLLINTIIPSKEMLLVYMYVNTHRFYIGFLQAFPLIQLSNGNVLLHIFHFQISTEEVERRESMVAPPLTPLPITSPLPSDDKLRKRRRSAESRVSRCSVNSTKLKSLKLLVDKAVEVRTGRWTRYR